MRKYPYEGVEIGQFGPSWTANNKSIPVAQPEPEVEADEDKGGDEDEDEDNDE